MKNYPAARAAIERIATLVVLAVLCVVSRAIATVAAHAPFRKHLVRRDLNALARAGSVSLLPLASAWNDRRDRAFCHRALLATLVVSTVLSAPIPFPQPPF